MLMLLRMKGETPEEIAGLTRALREDLALWQIGATIDWPSYAAGRSRGAPLFLLAAKLLAQAGARVLLHGFNSHQNPVASVRGALGPLGIETATSADAAAALLDRDGIAYAPLEALSPQMWDLIGLRNVLGLRSCMNTVARMMNPSAAPVSLQGVFHPGYRVLQQDAALALGDRNITVIKGGGGEFERHPAKPATVYSVTDGQAAETVLPEQINTHRRLHEAGEAVDVAALWAGTLDDPFATDVVVSTAALALWRAELAPTPDAADEQARSLWSNRAAQAAA